MAPWVKEPVPEHGASSVHFVNPNGRQGEAGQRFHEALPAGMASGGRGTYLFAIQGTPGSRTWSPLNHMFTPAKFLKVD